MERIDKFLANAGAGTRSEVKKYIKSDRIQVNGTVIRSSDFKIDEEKDDITFDGKSIRYEKYEYHMLHKPKGCVTATEDKHDKTVLDYIQSDRKNRLFPVGRLDKDTEGLLLITDDGELSHSLLSPKKHVDKIYFATVKGILSEDAKERFETGLDIGDEKPTLPAFLEILIEREAESDVLVTIKEGRFHQIKRMFLAIGSEVLYLKRLSMGPLVLDETLPAGESRKLTEEEIKKITALK